MTRLRQALLGLLFALTDWLLRMDEPDPQTSALILRRLRAPMSPIDLELQAHEVLARALGGSFGEARA